MSTQLRLNLEILGNWVVQPVGLRNSVTQTKHGDAAHLELWFLSPSDRGCSLGQRQGVRLTCRLFLPVLASRHNKVGNLL